MRGSTWVIVPIAALAVPAPAFAAQYLTVDQALKQAFPVAERYTPSPVSLTAAQWRAIDASTRAPVARREPRVWTAEAQGATVGFLYVDDVLGKQLDITYAVALGPDGRVLRVDILEYRETHGYEVRNARWLTQFQGATSPADLEFGRDIRNISGATLSCRHVTEGVTRLLTVHRVLHGD